MNGCKLLHIFNLWEAQLMTNLCSMERASSNEEEIKGNINVSPQGMPVEWACFKIEQCAYTLAFQETCQYPSEQQCTHWLEMNCPVVTGRYQSQPWIVKEPASPVRLASVLVLGSLNACWAHRDSLHGGLQCWILSHLSNFSTISVLWKYVMITKVSFVPRYKAIRQLNISKNFQHSNSQHFQNFLSRYFYLYFFMHMILLMKPKLAWPKT